MKMVRLGPWLEIGWPWSKEETWTLPATVRRWMTYGLCVVLSNLLLAEGLVRVVHQVVPLERPAVLKDRLHRVLIEGDNWTNGETRLYVYAPQPDGSLSMTHGHPFRINHSGFRGPEFTSKAPGAFRILVLGDSLTAGIGLAEEDRYTNLLEKKLRERYASANVEVINLGIDGYETVQEDKILHRMGAFLAPDLVIVGFYKNDPNITYDGNPPYKLPVSDVVRWVFDRLLFVRLLEPHYDTLYRWVNNIPTSAVIQTQHAYDPAWRDWILFERSVEHIAKWTIAHTGHSPLVVFLRDDSIGSDDFRYQQVQDTFVRRGFIWIDTEPGHYHPVSRFERHPNDESNRWYAEALFRTIVGLGVIPSHL